MSLFTHFSLNALEGMRGNIGKIVIKEHNNKNYFDVMLFLVPNADKEEDEATRYLKATQIVNVKFPEEAVKRLQEFDQGDYVRIGFSRIDLHKGISKKTGKEELFISAEATSIELLRKAKKKEALEPANEIKEEVKKVAQW